MLLDLLWLSVLAYVVVQIIVLWRASGFSRVAAALPLLVMIPVFVLTIVNLVLEKNLWPIFLLLASPLALLYVVVAYFMRSAAKQSPDHAARRQTCE
jgi:hypothetical protein